MPKPPGRPPIYDTPASARISLAVTPPSVSPSGASHDSQTTISTLLREAVNEWVSDYGDRGVFVPTSRRRRANLSA